MNRRSFMQFLGAATAGLAVARKTLTYAELRAMYDKVTGQKFMFFKPGPSTGRIVAAINIEVQAPRLGGTICTIQNGMVSYRAMTDAEYMIYRGKRHEKILQERNANYFERFGV